MKYLLLVALLAGCCPENKGMTPEQCKAWCAPRPVRSWSGGGWYCQCDTTCEEKIK